MTCRSRASWWASRPGSSATFASVADPCAGWKRTGSASAAASATACPRCRPARARSRLRRGNGGVIRIAQPLIGEEEKTAVMAVLESGRLASGPVTRELEEAFADEVAGVREAVAVSSGTAALHLALLAHGIGPGDEVITTAFSFQATSNMVLATGAGPVFVDVGVDGNIDPALIEEAITPRTRAILPVHLYGR